MGIYIKGMEMPKDDQKIRFVKLLNGKMYAVKETRNGFPLSYLHEVIEVTEPHERLIDAGELKKEVLKWLPSDPCGIEEKELPFETDIVVSLMMEIEEAPTVIEAEGE